MNHQPITFDGGEPLPEQPITHITLSAGTWRVVHKDGTEALIEADGYTQTPLVDLARAYKVS